jgi:hypothetical protein
MAMNKNRDKNATTMSRNCLLTFLLVQSSVVKEAILTTYHRRRLLGEDSVSEHYISINKNPVR